MVVLRAIAEGKSRGWRLGTIPADSKGLIASLDRLLLSFASASTFTSTSALACTVGRGKGGPLDGTLGPVHGVYRRRNAFGSPEAQVWCPVVSSCTMCSECRAAQQCGAMRSRGWRGAIGALESRCHGNMWGLGVGWCGVSGGFWSPTAHRTGRFSRWTSVFCKSLKACPIVLLW